MPGVLLFLPDLIGVSPQLPSKKTFGKSPGSGEIQQVIMPWLDHGILSLAAKDGPRIESWGSERQFASRPGQRQERPPHLARGAPASPPLALCGGSARQLLVAVATTSGALPGFGSHSLTARAVIQG